MAVSGRARRPRAWLDALFGEAWELERRRQRRYLFVALLVCVAVGAVELGLRNGRRAGAAAGAGAQVRIRSVALSLSGRYPQMGAVDGRIVVTGGAWGYLRFDGRVIGVCHSAVVDPSTLRVLSTARGNCGDPALYGRRVLPVAYVDNRSGPTGLTLAVRIATTDPRARAGYRLGPVVLTYEQCSDCQIGWVYGDGSLWIYSPLGPRLSERRGELLRVSESTGRVMQRWAMPVFLRALLAVNRDGLWISQSIYSGLPGHVPAAQRADYRSIYRVAPGMRMPVRARELGSQGAYWMIAAGHSVWVDESDAGRASRLWRFEGSNARAVISGRRLPSGSACGQTGASEPTIAGDAEAGIYCLDQSHGGVRAFDANRGIGRLHAGHWFLAGPAVSLGPSVYLLGLNGSGDLSRLFRVSS